MGEALPSSRRPKAVDDEDGHAYPVKLLSACRSELLDIGQPAECRGQPLECRGQPIECWGQPLECRGQPLECWGQPLECRGQTLECRGQPLQCRGQPVECQSWAASIYHFQRPLKIKIHTGYRVFVIKKNTIAVPMWTIRTLRYVSKYLSKMSKCTWYPVRK